MKYKEDMLDDLACSTAVTMGGIDSAAVHAADDCKCPKVESIGSRPKPTLLDRALALSDSRKLSTLSQYFQSHHCHLSAGYSLVSRQSILQSLNLS